MSDCAACGKNLPEDVTVCPSCHFAEQEVVQPFKANDVLEGRYRIDTEVGRGGMGVVYRGTDLTLRRPVAIKAMRAVDAEPSVVARFMREAQALARVEHRGLVPVYAVGREEGAYYMVMKFVEGSSLSELLKAEGAQPIKKVRRLVIEVCSALGALHKANLIHRDMKPGNVMVSPDGSITVMDLGIVKTVGENTQTTSTALGTPRYMPPEMLGDTEVDGRADLYSLGVIAWHALVGRPPFDGATPMAILYKQAHEPAEPLENLLPDIPLNLAAAIAKALEKDPDDRHQDADAFAAAIAADAEAPAARPKSKTAWVAAAAVVLLGGALAFFMTRPDGTEAGADAAGTLAAVVPDAALPVDAAPPPKDAKVEPDAAPPKDAALPVDAAKPKPKPKPKPRAMISWKVTSTPSGAQVLLRGRSIGRTPQTVRLPKGSRATNIVLKRNGYEPKTVRLSTGDSGRKHVKLESMFELVP